MIKKKHFSKVGMKKIYLNIIKATYNKPIANIILSSEKLKAFPQKIRNKTRMSILCNFIQHSFVNPSHDN